jgi:hypothetical protein
MLRSVLCLSVSIEVLMDQVLLALVALQGLQQMRWGIVASAAKETKAECGRNVSQHLSVPEPWIRYYDQRRGYTRWIYMYTATRSSFFWSNGSVMRW